MAQLIDGKKHAQKIINAVAHYTEVMVKKTNHPPSLNVILVGDNSASKIYIKGKKTKAEACGFDIAVHEFAHDISQAKLIEFITALNENQQVNAILVQLPLPPTLDSQKICQAIDKAKDVDGFNHSNTGQLWYNGSNSYRHDSTLLPCTPLAIMQLIHDIHGADLSRLNAVIVGRSNIVGKPVAGLLLSANATVTLAHSKTHELAKICRNADILIAAVGCPNLIGETYIKPGATVIDVGINKNSNNELLGDVDFNAGLKLANFITPVPGGVGPMTIALLMYNTLKASCVQVGYPIPDLLKTT